MNDYDNFSQVNAILKVRSDFVMQVTHREQRIGVSVYERKEKDEGDVTAV